MTSTATRDPSTGQFVKTDGQADESPAPRKPQRKVDITAFAREGENIYVQNTLATITYFELKIDGATEQCEWAPNGDPHGQDVMELPSLYLKNAKFREAMRKGIFKIVGADDEDVIEAFEKQQRDHEASQALKDEADRFVQMQAPRAFSGVQCLAQEGRGQCPEFAISSQNHRERPPLCSKHTHLASQFTPEETGRFTDGKPDIRWNRVTTWGY